MIPSKTDRQVRGHPGTAASVLLISSEDLILVHQFRPIFGLSLLEIPGGIIDAGESPEEAAVREVTEETGYLVAATTGLGIFAPTVGYSDERIHLFASRANLGPKRRPLAEMNGTTISIVALSLEAALRAVVESPIVDQKTMLGLLLYRARSDEIWARLS